MKINWDPPAPRAGPAGAWDKFVGPGSTDAEQWLQLLPTLLVAIAVPLLAWQRELGWNRTQYIVATLLAFDLAGGVVTNATAAAKRWYHRPQQGFRAHFGFVAIHLLHPFLVGWLFLAGNWLFVAAAYVFLLLAAAIILTRPHYLQRPTAFALYLIALFLSLYTLPPPAGMEWFLPVFYLKLLISHLLKEAPFYEEL